MAFGRQSAVRLEMLRAAERFFGLRASSFAFALALGSRLGGGPFALLLAAVREDARPHVELDEGAQDHQHAAGIDDRPAGVDGDLEDRLEPSGGLFVCGSRSGMITRLVEGVAVVVKRVVHRDRVRLVLDPVGLVGEPDLAHELGRLLGARLEADVEVVELQVEAQRLAVDVVGDRVDRIAKRDELRRRAGRG